MGAYQSFHPFDSPSRTTRSAARREWLVWLLTSLALALTPFAVIAVIFRAEYSDHGHHFFPTFTMLFGKGELLLVIVSVTGATLAELWLNPGHMKSVSKWAAIAASALIALAAGGLFTAIAYGGLTSSPPNIDHYFVAELSTILLILVVVIQTLTLLTRPDNRHIST